MRHGKKSLKLNKAAPPSEQHLRYGQGIWPDDTSTPSPPITFTILHLTCFHSRRPSLASTSSTETYSIHIIAFQMGAQSAQPSASTASLRRIKNFQIDDQTRFLYLILKQLDLKTVNWQHVADDLCIKNGHAARMRWSRFKQHVEGVPAAPRSRKDEGKNAKGDGKGKGTDMGMGMKRSGDDLAREDEGDSKRFKMEQGWPMHVGYGHGPPPPYYHGPPPYGMPPPHHAPHHPSYGPPPPGHYHTQPYHGPGQLAPRPHGQPMFQPPPSQYNQTTATPPTGTINPTSISKPVTIANIKPEPNPERTKQPVAVVKAEDPAVEIKPEPGVEPVAQPAARPSQPPHQSAATIENGEEKPNLPLPPASTPVDPAEPLSTTLVPTDATTDNSRQYSEVKVPKQSPIPAQEPQNTTSTTANIQEAKAPSQANENASQDLLSAVAEVSKEDFAKAVDAEATTHAQTFSAVGPQGASIALEQATTASPEIPLASIKAHTIRQPPAPITAPVATQAPSVTSGIVARAVSQAPKPAPKSTPSARSSKTPSVPPSPRAQSTSFPPFRPPPQGYPYYGAIHAPPLPPPGQPPLPIMPPHYHYTHRPAHITPPPYWHHIPHINNPPPPPFSISTPAHSHSMPDWSNNPHPFGPPPPPPHQFPNTPHSAPPQTLTFSDIFTPSNPPPLQQNHEAEDLHMGVMDEFDLTNFDFGMGDVIMEPQFVVADADGGIGTGKG